MDSLALCNVQLNLQAAYNNFFNKKRKVRSGFPKFKSRKTRNSYTTNNQRGTIAIIDDKYIKIPKIGKVKAVIHIFEKTFKMVLHIVNSYAIITLD